MSDQKRPCKSPAAATRCGPKAACFTPRRSDSPLTEQKLIKLIGAIKRRLTLTWLLSPTTLFQAALLIGVAALIFILIGNAAANLNKLSAVTGFGFLGETAGFAINQTLIAYSEQSTYGRVFVVGVLNTVLVAVLGIACATVLGFVLGILGISRNWLLRMLAASYVDFMRNVPLLLHLFFWYFAVLSPLPLPRASLQLGGGIFLNNRGLYLPRIDVMFTTPALWLCAAAGLAGFIACRIYFNKRRVAGAGFGKPLLTGIVLGCCAAALAWWSGGISATADLPRLQGFNFAGGVKVNPEFVALLLALSLYTAAFIGEIVRAGLLAVEEGQMEAASALGLSRLMAIRKVLIPQAMQLIIPPLTNQYLNLTKNSSLAVAIAYPDLVSVFARTSLNQTGQAIEILTITLGFYLGLSLITAGAMNWYNARIAARQAHG
jgi:general L-amino acid transport system permease protein